MATMLRISSVIVFFGVMAGVFYFTRPNELGIEGETFDWTRYIVISGILFVGIVFGSLYRRIMALEEEQINIAKEFIAAINARSFWSALLVSPFAFGSVYIFLETRPDDVVAFLFAFQNGFFCESIFREIHARGHRHAAEGHA